MFYNIFFCHFFWQFESYYINLPRFAPGCAYKVLGKFFKEIIK